MAAPRTHDQAKKLGRVLSVRAGNSTLLGAFDFCEVFLGRTNVNMSTALVLLIETTLANLRRANSLPSYRDEFEAGVLLDEKSGVGRGLRVNAGTQVHRLGALPSAAFEKLTERDVSPQLSPGVSNDDFAPTFAPSFAESDSDVSFENFNSNVDLGDELTDAEKEEEFARLIDQQVSELQAEEARDLLAKIAVRTDRHRDSTSSLVQTHHLTKVELYPEDAGLLADKFYKTAPDDVTRTAIRLVYVALPRANWSTEQASKLIEQTIVGLLAKREV